MPECKVKGRPRKEPPDCSKQRDLWSAVGAEPSRKTPAWTHQKETVTDPDPVGELVLVKAEIDRLKNELAELKKRDRKKALQSYQVFSGIIPAIVVHQYFKALALKETRKAIQPLKPSAGMTISTTVSPSSVGKTLGYPVGTVRKSLEQLTASDAVVAKGTGLIEVGRFAADCKGKTVPVWFLDFQKADDLAKLMKAVKQKKK